METCVNCKYIIFDKQLGEYCCTKLDSFTTSDDYCGYWEGQDG